MSGDWAAGPRVSHDLIVETGWMDGSVEMLVRAGLQDYVAEKCLWVQYTGVLTPGADAVFAEKFVGLGMDFRVSTWARPAWFRILHG